MVGQVIRYFFTQKVKYLAAKLHFSIINSLALLCMVWSVFCDGIASNAFHRMSGVDIIAIIGVDIFMYLLGCSVCLAVARVPWPSKLLSSPTPKLVRKWRFSRQDAVAIMVIIYLYYICIFMIIYLFICVLLNAHDFI